MVHTEGLDGEVVVVDELEDVVANAGGALLGPLG